MIPGSYGVPVIEKVLPDPVVPYAKTQALYPFITEGISCAHVFS